MNILVAEDDTVSALILRKTLETQSHSVTIARNGAEAWQALQEGLFEVMISDWMMPQMDGLELCRRLRGLPGRAYVYVLLLTAKGSREDRLVGLKAGADDFLVKPLDPGELAARLEIARRILGMQEALQEHATQLAQANARLTELAVTDGLTGLKNHRHFHEALEMHFSQAVRQGLALSVVMLDVDRFKPYNDTYGHPAGDEILRTVARLLGQNTRDYDVVARYGGEEFAFLLPGTDSLGARMTAERIRSAIQGYVWPGRTVTASFGVSTVAPATASASVLMEEADQALYHSKHQGRNRITHSQELTSANQELTAAAADPPYKLPTRG